MKVAGVGMGCCLIKTEVFDKIGTQEKGKEIPWFYFTTGYGQKPRESEDHYFFRRCAEEGYKIYCDTSAACIHISRVNGFISEEMWDFMRKEQFESNKPKVK